MIQLKMSDFENRTVLAKLICRDFIFDSLKRFKTLILKAFQTYLKIIVTLYFIRIILTIKINN